MLFRSLRHWNEPRSGVAFFFFVLAFAFLATGCFLIEQNSGIGRFEVLALDRGSVFTDDLHGETPTWTSRGGSISTIALPRPGRSGITGLPADTLCSRPGTDTVVRNSFCFHKTGGLSPWSETPILTDTAKIGYARPYENSRGERNRTLPFHVPRSYVEPIVKSDTGQPRLPVWS